MEAEVDGEEAESAVEAAIVVTEAQIVNETEAQIVNETEAQIVNETEAGPGIERGTVRGVLVVGDLESVTVEGVWSTLWIATKIKPFGSDRSASRSKSPKRRSKSPRKKSKSPKEKSKSPPAPGSKDLVGMLQHDRRAAGRRKIYNSEGKFMGYENEPAGIQKKEELTEQEKTAGIAVTCCSSTGLDRLKDTLLQALQAQRGLIGISGEVQRTTVWLHLNGSAGFQLISSDPRKALRRLSLFWSGCHAPDDWMIRIYVGNLPLGSSTTFLKHTINNAMQV
eukprot:768407-Hanusia_phi.AAC.5